MWVQTDAPDPVGVRIVLGAALELYATVQTYASLIPEPVLAEAARFSNAVAEHVEIVE